MILNNMIKPLKYSGIFRVRGILAITTAIIIILSSCTIKLGSLSFGYSAKGASTTGLKTVSVQFIENRVIENNGGIVQPTFSQEFTDALKDYIQSNTNLILINGVGDADFEGEVITYDLKPVSITANEIAAQNRFTISVKIRFVNNVNPEMDFENNFSRYENYESSLSFEDAQNVYTKDITDLLIEDIFNRAFVNW